MTPELKAKELVEKFTYYNHEEFAVPFATECVNEIITALEKLNPDYLKNTYWHPIDYWQSVRQEINNL